MNFDTFLLHSIYFIMKESTHVLNSIFSERKGMFFPLFGCKSILADYFTYGEGFDFICSNKWIQINLLINGCVMCLRVGNHQMNNNFY